MAADTRLDHRWIDLRTPANQAIFRIQSAVCQYFRANLASKVRVLKRSTFRLLRCAFVFLFSLSRLLPRTGLVSRNLDREALHIKEGRT